MSFRIRSSVSALLAALLVAVAIAATSAPASAASESTSATTAGDVGVLLSQRPCDVGERPRQIVLFLGIGGEQGQRCYGGAVGSIRLPNLPVFDLFSGGYTGAIGCTNRGHAFRPNQQLIIIDTCQAMTIDPA
jgi:hypothetical protein